MIWDQSFLRCSQILHFGLFGLPISSKGFLPTVVDIIVTWSKSPILVHFSSLIPEMSMFTLVISCLTTSNLPWFMDLPFQVPMQYCSLQHRTLLLSTVPSTTGYCFCFGSIPSFGEGNGTSLHCSCLENPRDGGAWWAAIYRVAQSRNEMTEMT